MEVAGTGAVAALAYLAGLIGKEHLDRLLGPSEDVIGAKLGSWTERRLNRTAEILEVGYQMLPDPENREKVVPPRVLDEIIENGSWTEDNVVVQYFGGVLASSRTLVPRDDRGVTLAKLVSQMSAYQLRGHYVFYSMFKQAFSGQALNVLTQANRMEMLVPFEPFNAAMEWSEEEDSDGAFSHLLIWLKRLDLLDLHAAGEKDFISSGWREVPEAGILVGPTATGVELFLWAHGKGEVDIKDFLSTDVVLNSSVEFDVPNVGIPVPL